MFYWPGHLFATIPMPPPAQKQQHYPGKRHSLGDAAGLGQLVVVRCGLCRRGATYLASDLAPLLGPARDALDPPFPCSGCGREDYVRVRLRLPRPGDWGNLPIRRPGPIRQIQTWRATRLGD